MGTHATNAKDNVPSLEKCFHSVQNELETGTSIPRLQQDIDKEDWKDVIKFTREYEAGFRGGVLKNIWKQQSGKNQNKGIELTNSFTFDLIGLNKDARIKDAKSAQRHLNQVKQDLVDVLSMMPTVLQK